MTQRLTATPGGPVAGTVRVPGDKSISHRALILGGLAGGTTAITGLLEGEDVLATARAVAALGPRVERTGPGAWRVTGADWRAPSAPLDCGNAGTGARLLLGALAGRGTRATVVGDASLSRRPMGRVLAPLAAMGAAFEGGPTLPVTVLGGVTRGIAHVSAVASAQVKTAVLLAGLGTGAPVSVTEPEMSRDHGERMLRAFGADVDWGATPEGAWRVALGARRRLTGTRVDVPGDPSSAAFPIGAALVTGGRVRVDGVLLNPARTGLLRALARMGARVEVDGDPDGDAPGSIVATGGPLTGCLHPAAGAAAMIDEYPLLAVVAAFARGITRMEGVGELRVKESDRIALMVDGLRACGVACEAGPDWLEVAGADGPVPGGALVETGGDHRIAMAFLVLGLGARAPVGVSEPGMIGTSFPGFVGLMRALGADIA